MSYEDAIRVADLKTRRSRFERVTGEVASRAGATACRSTNFCIPGVQEIADILPGGSRTVAIEVWLRATRSRAIRRQADAIVETTSLQRFPAALYAREPASVAAQIAALRTRPARSTHGSRPVEPLAREDYALAVEVAKCPAISEGLRRNSHLGDAKLRCRDERSPRKTAPETRERGRAVKNCGKPRSPTIPDEQLVGSAAGRRW